MIINSTNMRKMMLQTMVKLTNPLLVIQQRNPIMIPRTPPIVRTTIITYMKVSQQVRGQNSYGMPVKRGLKLPILLTYSYCRRFSADWLVSYESTFIGCLCVQKQQNWGGKLMVVCLENRNNSQNDWMNGPKRKSDLKGRFCHKLIRLFLRAQTKNTKTTKNSFYPNPYFFISKEILQPSLFHTIQPKIKNQAFHLKPPRYRIDKIIIFHFSTQEHQYLYTTNMEKDHDNRNKEQEIPPINARKSSNSNLCDICYQQYHILGKWPTLACPNSHYFCDVCIKGMLERNNNEPVPCPICRALIKKTLLKPNVMLFRTLNDDKIVKNALKGEENELFLYAFHYEIFQIAALFKDGKKDEIKNIQKLDLSNRTIGKIQHISMLKSLQVLHLENNLLESITELSGFPNLTILNLNHNKINNIDVLASLSKLESLAVEFNNLCEVNLMSLSRLKHLFLFGNQLGESLVDEFLMIEFPKLATLSFSINNPQSKYFNRNFIESLQISETLPSLKKLLLEQLFGEGEKRQLQSIARTINGFVQLCWISYGKEEKHEKWMHEFHLHRHFYGSVFNFIVDPLSPFLKDYELIGRKICKKTCNFTSLNSSLPIPKEGKQSFKFKIVQPSQHLFVGISNSYLKHNVNIYSEHFICLTLWGTIYSRGDCIPVTSTLKYTEKPVLRMTLDFDQQTIQWFCDDELVGFVPIAPQFKYSDLFFVFGMRDADTTIELLDE